MDNHYAPRVSKGNSSHGCLIAFLVILGLGICAVVAFFIFVGIIANRATSEVTRKVESTPSAEVEKPIEVSAEKLYAVYSQNEVLADAAFKDKLVSVSGKAGRIAKDMFNKSHLRFDTERPGITTIMCYFDDSQLEGLLSIRPGQRVTVTGRCTGMILSIVGLQHCSIQVKSKE